MVLMLMRYENINKLVQNLTLLFLKEGFNVQVYKSYNTTSCYIKLDYGLCYSIRIADHIGKKHLHYRYNIDTTRKKLLSRKVEYGRKRNYYGIKRINEMVADIMQENNEKIIACGGISEYMKLKEEYKLQNKDSKGFWQKAKSYDINEDNGKIIVRWLNKK